MGHGEGDHRPHGEVTVDRQFQIPISFLAFKIISIFHKYNQLRFRITVNCFGVICPLRKQFHWDIGSHVHLI